MKKGNIKRRIIAGALATVCMFSVSSSTVFATTNACANQSIVCSVENKKPDTGKVFAQGTSKALFNTITGFGKAVAKENAFVGGFMQVFSVFGGSMCDAALDGGESVTTQDLIDNIQKLSDNLSKYHDENMQNMKEISSELQNYKFHNITSDLALLTSKNNRVLKKIVGLTEIAQMLDKDDPSYKEDMTDLLEEIVSATVDNPSYTAQFNHLTDYVTGNTTEMNGIPVFEVYFNVLNDRCTATGDKKIQEECANKLGTFYNWCQTVYMNSYSLLMQGFTAKAKLYEMKRDILDDTPENQEQIKQYNLLINSTLDNMEFYSGLKISDTKDSYVQDTNSKYTKCFDIFRDSFVLLVTDTNNKAIITGSFEDAKNFLCKNRGKGEIKLYTDFYNNSLRDYTFERGYKVTIDLNGHSFFDFASNGKNDKNRKIEMFYLFNASATFFDSTNSGKSRIVTQKTSFFTLTDSDITLKNIILEKGWYGVMGHNSTFTFNNVNTDKIGHLYNDMDNTNTIKFE